MGGPLSQVSHNCGRAQWSLLPLPRITRFSWPPWQVVTNRDTQELLLCTAYVFEVSTSERGAQHHIYRLVRD